MGDRYTSVEATALLGTDGPEGVGETRPCVLCEYSHSMGNSNGNLHKYWEVNRKRKREEKYSVSSPQVALNSTLACLPSVPLVDVSQKRTNVRFHQPHDRACRLACEGVRPRVLCNNESTWFKSITGLVSHVKPGRIVLRHLFSIRRRD